jgi:hypothetical protein
VANAVRLLLFTAGRLIEDRLVSWANASIDARATGLYASLVRFAVWTASNPLGITGLVVVIVLFGLVIHAYVESGTRPNYGTAERFVEAEKGIRDARIQRAVLRAEEQERLKGLGAELTSLLDEGVALLMRLRGQPPINDLSHVDVMRHQQNDTDVEIWCDKVASTLRGKWVPEEVRYFLNCSSKLPQVGRLACHLERLDQVMKRLDASI